MECKQILVPVDGSQSSFCAASAAIELARAYEAEIEFLNVISFEGVMAGKNSADHTSVLEDAVVLGRKILENVLGLVPDGIEARGRCVSGQAAEAILMAADECHADMIVMGTRGLGTIKSVLLGSVSRSVLADAKCPVTLVKENVESSR